MQQAKCPSTEERRCGTYLYNGILVSCKKKHKIMPFAATWMQLEILKLSEINQKEKGIYYRISLICEIFKE